MAIRAAKLDAYRNLTEQLHGIVIQGETTIGEAVLTSDKLAAAVKGVVIGARTDKIEPSSSDTYRVQRVLILVRYLGKIDLAICTVTGNESRDKMHNLRRCVPRSSRHSDAELLCSVTRWHFGDTLRT